MSEITQTLPHNKTVRVRDQTNMIIDKNAAIVENKLKTTNQKYGKETKVNFVRVEISVSLDFSKFINEQLTVIKVIRNLKLKKK